MGGATVETDLLAGMEESMRIAGRAHGRRGRGVTTATALAGAVALGGLAACGGGTSPGAGAGAIAKYVPADSPLYFEVSTDLDSAQWTQAMTLAKVFPAYPKLSAKFTKELAEDNLDFARDIKPLLGKSAVIALTNATDLAKGDGDDPSVLAVFDFADEKRADLLALAGKADEPWTKTGSYKGFDLYRVDGDDTGAINSDVLLMATDEAELKRAIDASEGGTDDTMAGSERLQDALASLPDEVMAQGYMDIGQLAKAAGEGNAEAAKTLANAGVGADASLAMSISSEADGVRVKMITRDLGATASKANQEYSPKLLGNVPADAVAYVSLRNLYGIGEEAIAQLSASDPKLKDGLGQAKGALGLVGLSTADLKNLTGGEHAIVVTKGTTAPGVVLALEVADGPGAQKSLDTLRVNGIRLAGAAASGLPPFQQVPLANGVTGWGSKVDPDFGIYYGVDKNLALIGSQPEAIMQVQQPAATLADDPGYQAAIRQMPSKVTGFAWINGQELLGTLDRAGLLKDAPDDVVANLKPLKNLVGWTTGGDRPTAELFLTIAK